MIHDRMCTFEIETENEAAAVSPSTVLQMPLPTTITHATLRTLPNPTQAPAPIHES